MFSGQRAQQQNKCPFIPVGQMLKQTERVAKMVGRSTEVWTGRGQSFFDISVLLLSLHDLATARNWVDLVAFGAEPLEEAIARSFHQVWAESVVSPRTLHSGGD